MQIDATIELRWAGAPASVHGTCDPAFRGVYDAFAENYAVEEEIGSATAVMVGGKLVANLWAGSRFAAGSSPWVEDTIVCMMSVAKGISGIAFNILIDQGLVDPDAPVARYWPEFAQNGKSGVLVRHVLDHTAGLPVVLEPLWKGAIFDCDAIVAALERQAPLWEPGTVAAYHIHTQGNILGEIVRRVTGLRYPDFIARNLIRPLGLDYQIGNLSAADQARCADLSLTIEGTLFDAKTKAPDALITKGFTQHPEMAMDVTLNSKAWRTAEIASANGHGTARAVASIYGAVAHGAVAHGGRPGHSGPLRPETVADMLTEQHNQTERMQSRPYHQGRGVLLNTPTSVWMGPNARAFGHHGFGGSIGMGDVEAGLGFAYACNKMHARPDNGPRARRIIEAVYRAL